MDGAGDVRHEDVCAEPLRAAGRHARLSPRLDGKGGLRVIFSTDGGETWIAPAKGHGFLVDNSYGYGKAMELPDGSLFITYIATGGHRTEDAKTNGIRCIRLRVRADHSGIDLLPARQPGCEVTKAHRHEPEETAPI